MTTSNTNKNLARTGTALAGLLAALGLSTAVNTGIKDVSYSRVTHNPEYVTIGDRNIAHIQTENPDEVPILYSLDTELAKGLAPRDSLAPGDTLAEVTNGTLIGDIANLLGTSYDKLAWPLTHTNYQVLNGPGQPLGPEEAKKQELVRQWLATYIKEKNV